MCPKLRKNPALDPFCSRCGKYKGIGPCLNPNCRSYDNKTDPGSQVILNHSDWCSICGSPAEIKCHVCGQSFCDVHALGKNDSQLHHKDQHVGTCVKCNSYVCEDCWILNTSGSILCLYHLEKNEKRANE